MDLVSDWLSLEGLSAFAEPLPDEELFTGVDPAVLLPPTPASSISKTTSLLEYNLSVSNLLSNLQIPGPELASAPVLQTSTERRCRHGHVKRQCSRSHSSGMDERALDELALYLHMNMAADAVARASSAQLDWAYL